MPMTFAFNRKALDLIINEKYGNFEDIMWRNIWAKNNLIHKHVNNNENVIWNIHGKNISTFDFLR